MSLIYGDARLGSGGRMSDRELTAATQAQFSAMRDYRALTYALLDTLAGEGAQRAGRYQTTTDVAGLSEAKLSALESALTYNRILTAEMQLRGITGQLNALGESQRTSGRLNDAQAPKGGP
jgi:hypothetical protein